MNCLQSCCHCNRLGSDVEELCGVSQHCSGLKVGIDGAVHAIRDHFEDNRGSGWGLLLVDAKNAFNSLNRAAALRNILDGSIATVLQIPIQYLPASPLYYRGVPSPS